MIFASTDIKAQRLAVCRDCDDGRGGVCRVCGCVLTLKASLHNADCPRGLWATAAEEQP